MLHLVTKRETQFQGEKGKLQDKPDVQIVVFSLHSSFMSCGQNLEPHFPPQAGTKDLVLSPSVIHVVLMTAL